MAEVAPQPTNDFKEEPHLDRERQTALRECNVMRLTGDVWWMECSAVMRNAAEQKTKEQKKKCPVAHLLRGPLASLDAEDAGVVREAFRVHVDCVQLHANAHMQCTALHLPGLLPRPRLLASFASGGRGLGSSLVGLITRASHSRSADTSALSCLDLRLWREREVRSLGAARRSHTIGARWGGSAAVAWAD